MLIFSRRLNENILGLVVGEKPVTCTRFWKPPPKAVADLPVSVILSKIMLISDEIVKSSKILFKTVAVISA